MRICESGSFVLRFSLSFMRHFFYASFGRLGRFVSGARTMKGIDTTRFCKKILPARCGDYFANWKLDLVLTSDTRKYLCRCNKHKVIGRKNQWSMNKGMTEKYYLWVYVLLVTIYRTDRILCHLRPR